MHTSMSHSPAYAKFQASKTIDLEKWREGEGYDMDAFAAMSQAERDAEADAAMALEHPDWRDLEVLGAHNSKQCIAHLRDLLLHPSVDTRAHALGVLIDGGHTPGSVPDGQLAHVIEAIDNDDDEGMTYALMLAQNHAGAMSKLALLRGAQEKPALALHFAAALLDLAGLSNDMAAFDPMFRPTLLRLLPDNAQSDRVAAFNEICRHMKIDPQSIPVAGDGKDRTWAEKIWPRA